MKHLLALCIFAIELMVALPSTSSGSASPPGQSSFVVGHFDIAPAMAFVPENFLVVEYSRLAPVAIELQEKGGYTIEKSLNTSLDVGYNFKNAMCEAPYYTLFCKPDFRLCQPLMAIQSQKFIQKNIRSVNRLARDGLTQV